MMMMMMTTMMSVVLGLFVLLEFNPVQAIICNQCSGFDPNCGDPTKLEANKAGHCTGGSCVSMLLTHPDSPAEERLRFCSNTLKVHPSGKNCLVEKSQAKTCVCDHAPKCNKEKSVVEYAKPKGTVYRCYSCSGDDCNEDFLNMATCKGSACISMVLRHNGRSEQIRACSYSTKKDLTGCKVDTLYDGVKRLICRCTGDICNIRFGYNEGTFFENLSRDFKDFFKG